jgi:hypothetical protein
LTTALWNSQVGPRARALDAIKSKHCAPPTYEPAADTKGHIECPKCRKSLKFTVLASNGCTTGRCATAGCLAWRE